MPFFFVTAGLLLIPLTCYIVMDTYFEKHPLEEKKAEEDVWIGLLAEKYGMTMNNYGKGGSPVSLFDDKYGSSMMNRYEGMANNNADIILLEGGKNDYNFHTPIGTTDSRDDRTFKGALNVMIDSFKVKYPNAMIVLITVWNFPGGNNLNLDYNDYANAMVDVANAQGIYCLKACDSSISGVNMNDATFRAKYCIKPTDVSHLNADGMKYIFPKMEDKISEFWCDFCAKRESK